MPDERRYRDEEVRKIFEGATRQPVGGLPARTEEGLTLSELQEIGREVGLDATAVASSAAALDTRALAPQPLTSLGMPVAVSRVVPLPRSPTDAEWERLVAELRTTFGARGRVSSAGGLREWSNGNLHALVEPTDTGYQLRLGTVKGDAAPLNVLGAMGVVTGAFTYAALLSSGGLADAFFVPWMIGAAGIAAVVGNAFRLPRWASRREAQMRQVAAKAEAMIDDT